MSLKTLTYTSLARLDINDTDLRDILTDARDLNAIDGITGMLIFNGTRFLQMLEGSPKAIDDLVERLRRDRRHSSLEIREDRPIDVPSFAGWSMELVKVQSKHFEARETIAERLPTTMSAQVRQHVLTMTDAISGTVSL